MRRLIISALIITALVGCCISLEPIMISQERGMTVLANLSDKPVNQSEMNNSTAQDLTNQTGGQANLTSSGLWSWGRIPAGYQLNENGTLTRMNDQQWTPSI